MTDNFPKKLSTKQLKENLWVTEKGAYYRHGQVFAAVRNSLVLIGDYCKVYRGFDCRYQDPEDINRLFRVLNKNGSRKKFKYAFECADYLLDLAKRKGFFCSKKYPAYMKTTAYSLQFPKEPKVSKYPCPPATSAAASKAINPRPTPAIADAALNTETRT